MPTPMFRSSDAPAVKNRRARSSSARPALITGLLLLAVSVHGFAQQRIIVNPNFVKRVDRNGNAISDYNVLVPNSSCSPANSCIRYLGDARCLPPSGTPVDNQGCMVGWITTDPYDGNTRSPFIQNGFIKAPTQVGLGPSVEGLNVPNGAAELNAENAGRLYQKICLASGEVIPFSYSLGDPVSTFSDFSQAKFGIFVDNTNYPGTAVATVNSSMVSTQTMVPQSGTVTAPIGGGLFQVGFEAINPPSGAVGNYIANVSITLKPLVDFAAPALQILEGQSGFLLVRVNGTVPAGGISVSLQPGAATASPSEHALGAPMAFGSSIVGNASLSSNGAGGYLLFIPQGAYDGNALSDARNETATNPSGSVRIPISTVDDTVVEDNKTFSLIVEPPGTNGSSPVAQWDLATAAPCSPNPAETATVTIVDNDVDLAVAKLVDNAAPAAGGNVTYTVTFNNNTARPTIAPLTAHDATAPVSDAVPSGLSFTSWTCTASGGASCPGGAVNGVTSGSGAIGGNAFLPAGSGAAGGTVTYTIAAQVGSTQCTSVQNTATITVPAPLQEATVADPGFTTPSPGGGSDNSASASIAPICPATLAVAVTDGSTTYTPGSTGTYTVTITNSGLAAAMGLTVSDALPGGVTLTATPTCAATGTATCGTISGTAGGSSFGATGASLATGAGNSLVYTLPVAFAPTLTVDPLVSTASVSASNAPTPVIGSDSDTRSPFTVGISKSSSSTVAQPGGTVSYTVTATNGGTVAAPGAVVADPLPTGIASFTWSCGAAGGAACPNATGSGAINETLATFPAGGSVQYQISAVVSAAPPAAVTNTATITPPSGGACAGSCSATVTTPAAAMITIDAPTASFNAAAGQNVTFSFTVTSSGNGPADGAHIDDPLPAGLVSFTWTCAASGGAVCPNASGTGPISETVATFPAGGGLTYTVTALVASNPPPTITNTVTATPSAGGICGGSCTLTMLIGIAIQSIPTLGTLGLLLLAACLGGAAILFLRR